MTESPAGPALEPLPGLKLWPGRLDAAAQAALSAKAGTEREKDR